MAPRSMSFRKALGLKKADSQEHSNASSARSSTWSSFRVGRSHSDQSDGVSTLIPGDDSNPDHLHAIPSSSQSHLGQISKSQTWSPIQEESLVSKENPRGLTVVHLPDSNARADIVFIHGLGGSSQGTWSKGKNPDLFWPKTFLSTENDICSARIMTFGYNADLFSGGRSTVSIYDFANDLLFHLKHAKGEDGNGLRIGDIPLVFVAHSMGGLVVKEAYLQGQSDPEYEHIIQAVRAIIFMATPHRGSDYAGLLEKILRVTTGSKPYVQDLTRNSTALQRINDQFRHIAPKLDIVSFFETLPTPIPPFNTNSITVVTKDSAVLGYPGEVAKALDADHHSVCKYGSQQDHSYETVRDYLKTQLVRLFRNKSSRASTQSTSVTDVLHLLEEFFAISEAAEMDYAFFGDRWTPGTCGWILEDEAFIEWRDDPDPSSRLLWLHGVAGSGKSVMAAFLVNHLISEAGKLCQYVFLRFGDLNKKSISTMLRSLAMQCARAFPEFRLALQRISTRANLSGNHPRTIWERIFKAVLFKLRFSEPLYWVIDGLEECESPRSAIRLLSEALQAPVPIRIILTSRPASGIAAELKQLPREAKYQHMALQGHDSDQLTFIKQQLERPDGSGELAHRLITAAQGNFLWMKLTIDRINKSYTDAAIEEALRELHPGMEDLYNRMVGSVEERSSSSSLDKALSNDILSWVTCSMRLLSISELSEGLDAGTDQTLNLNLQKAITDLGGGFVIVDNDERVSLIHQTAREFLMKPRDGLFIDKKAENERLLLRCLVCLSTPSLRKMIAEDREPVLLEYAANYWSAHLANSNATRSMVLARLVRFLRSPSVLTWIHAVAKKRQLHVLLQASNQLLSFAEGQKSESFAVESTPVDEHTASMFTDNLKLLEDWATDLGKLVGKFGSQLLHTPDSIYKMIPPFCPKGSAIHRQFVRRNSFDLSVSGFNNYWDDSLARLSFSAEFEGSTLTAQGDFIAVCVSSNSSNTSTIFLYSSTTFQEVRRIPHGEKLRKTTFNSLGTLLVTIGLSKTLVWELHTGKCVNMAQNPRGRPRPQTVSFVSLDQEDDVLYVGTDDRRVWSMSLLESETKFEEVIRVTETAATGGVANSPSSMAFSPDGRHLALGYRQRPLSVWDIDSHELVRYCPNLTHVAPIVWHPYDGTIFGLTSQTGSRIIKWSADDDEKLISFYVEAITIAISADGHVLALGDQYGTVSLLNTADLSVLHKLISQDPVFGLAFSIDGSRLYDIRSAYGNVWEPNVLLKLSRPTLQLSDLGESESDSDSRITPSFPRGTPIEAPPIKIDPITSLGSQTSNGLYCSGSRRGVVTLHDISRGELKKLSDSKNYFSIQKISWSPDQHLVCYADVSRAIFVESVAQDADSSSFTVERILEMTVKALQDNIENLIFHSGSDLLLICSKTTAVVVSIKRQTVVATHHVDSGESIGRWTRDPANPDRLIVFKPACVEVHSWLSLEKLVSVPLDTSSRQYLEIHSRVAQAPMSDFHATDDRSEPHDVSHDSMEVDDAIFSPSQRHALLRLSTQDHRNFTRWLDVSRLDAYVQGDEVETGSVVKDVVLPGYLIEQLDRALGFLSGTHGSSHEDKLLFLDCNSWVCTCQVPTSDRRISSSHQMPSDPSHQEMRSETETGKIAESTAVAHTYQETAHEQPREQGQADLVQSSVIRHYCLPGDWVSPDCIALIQSSDDGMVLCPRNGEVAVVRFPGFT